MLPIDFISAQYGSVLKAAGSYTNQRVEGIAANGSGGLTITELENQDDIDVLSKYVAGGEVLFAPNFIRVDNVEDFYFKKITISEVGCFILNKEV